MDEFYNRHYITTDAQGCIVSGWSDGPHPDRDTTNAICINEQGGYQFRLSQDSEENPPLYDMNGVPLYYWDGENILHRTNEDIQADISNIVIPPSPQDQLRADIDFLAALQGVVL